jgi:hypothetical protein
MWLWLAMGLLGTVLAGWFAYRQLRRRGLSPWIVPYALQVLRRRRPAPHEEIHLLLCLADHFEPRADGASAAEARARIEHWVREYPRQLGYFRDSDGRPPRYTFFYPAEDYEPDYLDLLAQLCRAGFAEVEVHLHHERDTAAGLRTKLLAFKNVLAERHQLLARHRRSGEIAYGFIHGNWALCNSRADRRWCGVNEELAVLHETGCYADFTLPAAPNLAQTRKINSVYYAWDRPGRRRSHETGIDVGAGTAPAGSLMLIQGPLLLAWKNGRWGLRPHIDNGCLQANQPPTLDRLDHWLRARVQVASRPDWYFVKLHAHGATKASHAVLLGEPMQRFHEALARRARDNPAFHYHYVTAREMYNLARAAEAGWKGSVAEALDYELVWNGSLERGNGAAAWQYNQEMTIFSGDKVHVSSRSGSPAPGAAQQGWG